MFKQWLIPALAAVLIAGCTTTATVVSETPESAPPTTAPAAPQETPSAEPSEVASQAPTLMDPTLAPAATVRPALEATDPDGVDLTSGPTLVEFFAFW